MERNQLLELSLLKQIKFLDVKDIRDYYEVVDFLIQVGIIKDLEKDAGYIYYVIHCGKMSYQELGLQYADNYLEMAIESMLEKAETHEELMKYVDYKKILENIENEGDYYWDIPRYVDVEALGHALVEEFGFSVEYFRVGENVFEFEKTNADSMMDHYLNEDAVIYTYLTVKNYLEAPQKNIDEVLAACELTKNEFMNNSLEVA